MNRLFLFLALFFVSVLSSFSQGTSRVSNLKVDGGIVFGSSTSELTEISGSITYAGVIIGQSYSPAIQLITETNITYFIPYANSATARGAALTNAITTALANSELKKTILIPPGVFNVGAVGIYHTNLQLIGSGVDSTIISGRISFAKGFQCLFSDLTITNNILNTDTFMCSGFWTDNTKSILRNLKIFASGGTVHAMQLTGDGWTIDNVESYGGTNAHTFVLKGVRNAIIRNCKSIGGFYSGFLIKSDEALGMNSNIVVDGLSIEEPNSTAIFLNSQVNTWMSGIRISNVRVSKSSGAGSCIYVGDSASSATNNPITNTYIDNSYFFWPQGSTITANDFEGTVVVSRCTFVVQGPNGPAIANNSDTSSKLNFADIQILSVSNGSKYYENFSTGVSFNRDVYKTSLNRKNSTSISSGSLSNYINSTYATNGLLYIGMTSSYEWKSTSLASNDPVWITTGGSAAGVLRLLEWGTSTNTGHPHVGAVSGCFYAVMSSVTNSGTFKIADAYPGKNYGVFYGSSAAYNRFTVQIRVSTLDDLAKAGDVTYNANWQIGIGAPTDFNTHTYYTNQASYVPFYARTFAYSNVVYIGVFGGGSSAGGWLPSSFLDPSVEVEMRVNQKYTSVGDSFSLP